MQQDNIEHEEIFFHKLLINVQKLNHLFGYKQFDIIMALYNEVIFVQVDFVQLQLLVAKCIRKKNVVERNQVFLYMHSYRFKILSQITIIESFFSTYLSIKFLLWLRRFNIIRTFRFYRCFTIFIFWFIRDEIAQFYSNWF